MDSNGKMVQELVGKWDESVDRKIGKDNFERLWQIAEFPSGEFIASSDLYLPLMSSIALIPQILDVSMVSLISHSVSTKLHLSMQVTLQPIPVYVLISSL